MQQTNSIKADYTAFFCLHACYVVCLQSIYVCVTQLVYEIRHVLCVEGCL